MNKQLVESMFLAWRDWKFEYLLSLCAILALASMLTPLLVMQGLKNGVIEGMRSRLLEDPTVMIITPKSDAGSFSSAFIKELGSLPGARFAIGRTRETSTDISMFNPETGARLSIALEPATPGEPVLEKYAMPVPINGDEPQIVLSSTAARALGVTKGGKLDARLGRRTPAGKLESINLTMHVADVLPLEAADRKMGFVALKLMEDIENFRDYIAVPERNFTGDKLDKPRDYSSFRLYASSLDKVEALAEWLANKKIEVYTKAREIASIRMLENAINMVILIISIAVGSGFAAFTLSSVHSAVSRKKRMLGMLRLLGFNRLPLMFYPLTQTILTAVSGFLLSLLVYIGVSYAISYVFSRQGVGCLLTYGDVCLTAIAVILLSVLSCLKAAIEASEVEPSIVIREV